jgi:hypothetical protein
MFGSAAPNFMEGAENVPTYFVYFSGLSNFVGRGRQMKKKKKGDYLIVKLLQALTKTHKHTLNKTFIQK